MSLKKMMNELVPGWKDELERVQIRIKKLEFDKKHETDESKKEKLSEEIKKEEDRLVLCEQKIEVYSNW